MRRPATIDNHRKLVTAARAYIRKHLADPSLSVSAVAAELAISNRQLQRVLRAELDTTCANLILQLRMQEAHRRLSRGESARVVAERVGYSHGSGLARAFRRLYRQAPQAHLTGDP